MTASTPAMVTPMRLVDTGRMGRACRSVDVSDEKNEKNLVKSVVKAFAVLQSFGPDSEELVIADVARAAGTDNATAFRMLNTLVSLGYVEKVPDSRRFRLTFKCLELGFNAIARSDIRSLGRPLLRSLVSDRIEAASIGVLDGAEVVYVERIQAGLQRLAVDVRVGNRVPAFSSALGRAILAHLPLDDERAILEANPPKPLTAFTLTDVDQILGEMAKVRASGFAVSDQETVSGLRVLAAPITDVDGIPIAALSVASPAFGQSLDQFIEAAAGPTCAAARQLSLAVRAAGATAAHPLTP